MSTILYCTDEFGLAWFEQAIQSVENGFDELAEDLQDEINLFIRGNMPRELRIAVSAHLNEEKEKLYVPSRPLVCKAFPNTCGGWI